MPYRASELRAPKGPRRGLPLWPLAALAGCSLAAVGYLAARADAGRSPVVARMPLPRAACDQIEVMAERPDGARDVLCDRVRETLPGEGTAIVAAQRFVRRVVSATPVERGWVFVTADGTVTHSDTFTGRLHLLGRVPCLDVTSRSTGRAVVIDADGALWTTDGRTPLMKWTLPRRVRSAVFTSAAHGAVALEGGEVMVTRDAGGAWARIDLHGEVAVAVGLLGRDHVEVVTPSGARDLLGDFNSPSFREPGTCPVPTDSRAIGATWRTDERAAQASVGAQETFEVATFDDRCAGATPPSEGPVRQALRAERRTLWCSIARGRRRVRATAPTVAAGIEANVDLGTSAGRVESILWPDAGGRGYLFAWRGRDARGAFRGLSSPDGEPDRLPGALVPDSEVRGHTRVEVIARSGLLVRPGARGDVLYWAADRGAMSLLARPPTACFQVAPRSVGAVMPDGGVAWVQSFPIHGGVAVATVTIGPDGGVRRGGLLAAAGDAVDLGRWGGVTGVVAGPQRETAPGTFHPLDGSPPRQLPHLPPSSPPACAAPRAANDREVVTLWRAVDHMDAVTLAEDGRRTFATVSREELEVRGGETCLRAVTLRDLGRGAIGTTLEARAFGRFEGTRGDEGEQAVSCHVSEDVEGIPL